MRCVIAALSLSLPLEQLFGNAKLMATALAAAAMVIIVLSRMAIAGRQDVSMRSALWIGAVQGCACHFADFSAPARQFPPALTLGVDRRRAEQFSFALAVALTPVVVAKEGYRLYKADLASVSAGVGLVWHLIGPGLLGMALSFLVGLLALRWLSRCRVRRWRLLKGCCGQWAWRQAQWPSRVSATGVKKPLSG